jgi:hypothetical protein
VADDASPLQGVHRLEAELADRHGVRLAQGRFDLAPLGAQDRLPLGAQLFHGQGGEPRPLFERMGIGADRCIHLFRAR